MMPCFRPVESHGVSTKGTREVAWEITMDGFVNTASGIPRWSFSSAVNRCPSTSSSRVYCGPKPAGSIQGTVKQVKESLQSGLRAKLSRMEVEVPAGSDFGTENHTFQTSSESITTDRQLARLILEMFAGNQLKSVVVFGKAVQAHDAQRVWGPTVEVSGILSIELDIRSRKGFSSGGSGKKRTTKTSSEVDKSLRNVDLLILTSLDEDDLEKAAELVNEYGMGTLIILVNSRIQGMDTLVAVPSIRGYFQKEFEPVYILRPNPHPQWSGGVLFRSFPNPWLICRKQTIGPARVLLESDRLPSLDEVSEAFRTESQNPMNVLINKVSEILSPR